MGYFNFVQTGIEGLVIIEPMVFGDDRGFFMETYSHRDFSACGLDVQFVQDNHSKSKRGVLRGLHFQVNSPQGKLVRVIRGEVYDVAVDIRRDSATFGQWRGVVLSESNRRQLYVPEGFAHGFLAASEFVELTYKCTQYYDATDESGILWNDPDIGVEWPIMNNMEIILSDKDAKLQDWCHFAEN